MRIAIVADTHMPRGNRRLPDECVERLRAADLIVHAGDFSGPETLAEFEAFGPPLVAVRGNVEEPAVRERLPEIASFEAEGARVAVIHDAGPRQGRLQRLRQEFPEADAVVFGHSHMPLHESENGFQIFNPGSPTERRRAPSKSMGAAVAEAGEITFELVDLGR